MQSIFLPQAKNFQISLDTAAEKKNAGMAGPYNAAMALQTLTKTMEILGLSLQNNDPSSELTILWGAGSAQHKKIYFEHGWLPRWAYQISPQGTNSISHIAQNYRPDFPVHLRHNQLMGHVKSCRAIWQTQFSHSYDELLQRLPEKFILVPLQSPFSTYIQKYKHKFWGDRTIERSKLGYQQLAQAMIDLVEGFNLALPIVFRQEPRDPNNYDDNDIILQSSHNLFMPNTIKVSQHQILALPNCAGLVTLNSNSLNEALIWDVPTISLTPFLWPADCKNPPVSMKGKDGQYEDFFNCKPLADIRVQHYLKYILEHQWWINDLQNPLIVKRILETSGLCHPFLTRMEFSELGSSDISDTVIKKIHQLHGAKEHIQHTKQLAKLARKEKKLQEKEDSLRQRPIVTKLWRKTAKFFLKQEDFWKDFWRKHMVNKP